MTDKTISPLRQRMIEDMRIRGFTPTTQRGYIAAVRDFTAFFGRSPDQARAEDLRRYQLHMRSSEGAPSRENRERDAEAEPLYKRALAIDEKALGQEHPLVATSLENYAVLLRKTGRSSEATEMEARAKAIRAKHAKENP